MSTLSEQLEELRSTSPGPGSPKPVLDEWVGRLDAMVEELDPTALELDDLFAGAQALGCAIDPEHLAKAVEWSKLALDRGHPEAGPVYAYSIDARLLNRREPQRYGTVWWWSSGETYLPAVDPSVTDEERTSLGVKPLSETQAELQRLTEESTAAAWASSEIDEPMVRVLPPEDVRRSVDGPVARLGNDLYFAWPAPAFVGHPISRMMWPDGDRHIAVMRVRDLGRAVISWSITPLGATEPAASGVWRGPDAPPEPPQADPIAGELVTETLDYDGGRQVTVYIPPDPPEAVVFAGDGHLISQWGGFLEAADVPSTMIVGVHRSADEAQRLHEYSPAFDQERFAAHERFFVEDVRRWTQARFGVALPAERTAVFGVSAGGELALAIGLRHPDVYGALFLGSPGAGYQPPDDLPSPLPRAYLVAGTLEPFFKENATRWAAALRDAGADVVMSERVSEHDHAMWREEFPLMVAWAFGA